MRRCSWSCLALHLGLLLLVSGCGRLPGVLSAPSPPAPGDLLLQLDWRPGYLRSFELSPHARVPPFSLFGDGRVIYVDQDFEHDHRQVMDAQLSPAETQALLQQVSELGFEELESYTEWCGVGPDGVETCLNDANTLIFRGRLPSGQLRELEFYGNLAADPQAVAAIEALLAGYVHPHATRYTPQQATLYLSISEPDSSTALPWPIDPRWLPDSADPSLVRKLAGKELERFLAAVPRNIGSFSFSYESQRYDAYLVPWLPGVDYSAEFELPPAQLDQEETTPTPR